LLTGMSLWNSIDSLRQTSLVLMWVAGLLAVGAAGATLLRYYVDRRISELTSQAQQAKEELAARAQQEKEEEHRQRQEAAEGELKDFRAREQENRRRHEAAEQELESMRAKAAPRSLPSKAREAMSTFLKNQAKGSVVIKASVNAPDARAYGDEIRTVLTQAGWTVRIDNAMFAGSDIAGVWITVKDPKKAPAAAGLLQNALKAAGVDARGEYDPTMDAPDSEFWLSVGNK
jgi:hypothetical protein